MSDAHEQQLFEEQKAKRADSFFVELLKFALVSLVIVLPIRIFIAQPFIVSGASMEPTFEDGEYLIVDELTYRFAEPERGDVVIFRYPKDPSKFFIKRIIGLPSETLRFQDGTIIVENEADPDGFLLQEPYVDTPLQGLSDVTLNESQYYVLGDNRPASSDSRVWGPLDADLIVGRAFLRLFPVDRLNVLPGSTAPQIFNPVS